MTLPKPLKTYKPDLESTDLGVAIEYKFAASEQDVKTAVDGIFSDMQGYAGSSQWRTFYAVIYMTGVLHARASRRSRRGLRSAPELADLARSRCGFKDDQAQRQDDDYEEERTATFWHCRRSRRSNAYRPSRRVRCP